MCVLNEYIMLSFEKCWMDGGCNVCSVEFCFWREVCVCVCSRLERCGGGGGGGYLLRGQYTTVRERERER